jgi:hypothetical protein
LPCSVRHTLPTITAANNATVPLSGTPIPRGGHDTADTDAAWTGTTGEYDVSVTAITEKQTILGDEHLFDASAPRWHNGHGKPPDQKIGETMNRIASNEKVSTTLVMGELYRSAPRLVGGLAVALAGLVTLATVAIAF